MYSDAILIVHMLEQFGLLNLRFLVFFSYSFCISTLSCIFCTIASCFIVKLIIRQKCTTYMLRQYLQHVHYNFFLQVAPKPAWIQCQMNSLQHYKLIF